MSGNKKSTQHLTERQVVSLLLVAGLLLAATAPAKADFVFSPAENCGPVVNTSLYEIQPVPEGLSLWFERRSGTGGAWETWRVSRATQDAPWGSPENFGPWDESDWNLIKVEPSFTTRDGLELYWGTETDRPGGYGGKDLYMKRRQKLDDDWGPAINLGPTVNSAYDETCPTVSPNGLELYFSGWSSDARPGGYGGADLWVTRRATRDDPWGEPVNLGPTVNSSAFDARPFLLGDGLLLFFESNRPGGFGSADLYMMRRATISDPWSEPMNLGPRVNGPASDENGFLSLDGSTLYFHSNRAGGQGGYDIWQAAVMPIVDFNGDGIVDLKDFSQLAQYWGQDEPSVDIGPTPFGDHIVDIQDVRVLGECWVTYPGTVAHWKLDETEGNIAQDSAGTHNGIVMTANPLWRPDEGQVKGALELDGVDDYISTPFVLNPANGPFSVFAWIKGNIPGAGILCQEGGANWLSTLPPMGWLMTELAAEGARVRVLISQIVVTDDQWHRVGLTWDGTNRRLYVDDAVVAGDTQTTLPDSTGCLHIGASTSLAPGSFWSGLIDDIRIYDRAVIP